MIRTLLRVRFRALLSGLSSRANRSGKNSKKTAVLFAVLYAYVFIVVVGMMSVTFYSLAQPYHALGLDWLYFSIAALMGFGFALIGSVFTTQNQLYDARDNAMLLAMPIPPSAILLSRMVPLLLMNLMFAGSVMIPAIAVYAIFVRFSLIGILLQLLGLAATVLLAQALACLLGWLLHQLLKRINKSLASMLYMIVFLVVYFSVYSQAQNILNTMLLESGTIAQGIAAWVWPLYALGMGATGSVLHALVMPAVSAALFGSIYWFLSATFLSSAASGARSQKKRRLDLSHSQTRSPIRAIMSKELGKFLGSPVYLTNMGLGILLLVAMPVAALIFRDKLTQTLQLLPLPGDVLPLAVCAATAFMISTISISTPSVSLEGKNIWILQSLPVDPKEILLGKLAFHCARSVPVSVFSGLALGVLLDFDIAEILLCGLFPGLLALLSGILGMLTGLRWARLDYINDAYPCKQSVSVAITMFSVMGLSAIMALVYFLTPAGSLSTAVYLAICSGVIALLCFGLYKLLVTWGVNAWNKL